MKKLIHQFKNLEIIIILCCFLVLIILILMLRDYLTTLLNGSSFQFSSALLYKNTYVLFLVPIFMHHRWKHLCYEKHLNLSKLIAVLIPVCVLHIIIASWLISILAQTLFDLPVTFSEIMQWQLSKELIFIISIYGFIFLMARYYALNINDNLASQQKIKLSTATKDIEISNIDWIGIEQSYLIIWVNQRKYKHHASVDQISNQLNHQFIRINPSTIVNKEKIESIQARADGDFDVVLRNSHKLILNKIYKNSIDRH